MKRESRQQHEPYGETRTNREAAMAVDEGCEQMFKQHSHSLGRRVNHIPRPCRFPYTIPKRKHWIYAVLVGRLTGEIGKNKILVIVYLRILRIYAIE